MNLTRYGDILKDNGIEWDTESMKNADVSISNVQCIGAIMGAVRAERFCNGALLDFFKSGYILKWLERLNNTAYVDTFYLCRKESKGLFWKALIATDFENVAKNGLIKALTENSTGNVKLLVNSYLFI